jgi:uncharacterized repeat protein (TIGR03837 family)
MPAISCDVFCTVIDNYGDAGVCWRLAKQLAAEHGWRVRLWIDDPAIIDMLAPGQTLIEVRAWTEKFSGIAAADVVIEAFACQLPAAYLPLMQARSRAPVWLNLEYLSAEDWVAGCHGLPSPQAGLQKHFFFPGYTPGTGGLLHERAPAVTQKLTFAGALDVSLFCYDNPALSGLLDAWRDGDRPITCHVCAGYPAKQVGAWLGEDFPVSASVRRGNLTLHSLPFLPQADYDALLDRCHLNFVRGEDSFVRAQWAERPFVWQAYVQAENVHLAKLEAFLALYSKVSTCETAPADFFRAWNGNGALNWPEFAACLPALAAAAPDWARRIAAHGDLATNLVRFCREKL